MILVPKLTPSEYLFWTHTIQQSNMLASTSMIVGVCVCVYEYNFIVKHCVYRGVCVYVYGYPARKNMENDLTN